MNGIGPDPIDPPSDVDMVDGSFDKQYEEPDVTLLDFTQDDENPTRPLPRRADDEEAMKKIAFPDTVELPRPLSDTVHTWEIKNWRSLARREHGPVFQAGGYPWRVLMFPSGNNVNQASFYLEHGYQDKPPEDFVCCVQFALVLWNPKDPTLYHIHHAHHRFTAEEGDWGFTKFVDLRQLFNSTWKDSGRPLLENDEANMTAYVRVVEDETGVLWHNFLNYDSKKETGYVGLKNQGATCYLNSLIQSLYNTNAFRKAVYLIPTQDELTLANSAYTLQRLFYYLQTAPVAVSTHELTKSFGWETKQVFEQQDVQELSRKLMERLEEKMKGTEAENVLPQLFCGKVRTYISCINVEYESARLEDFWDIQLNVAGNKSVEDSLEDYIKEETMDGDNQYFAGDQFKLQDAKKGVIFESFPEVLNLQLKRFEYNIEQDAMTKVNERYDFPEEFDASKYLAPNADKTEPYIYKLHSVLVHSGDLNAGHYYAFIRPAATGWFYKYDDDKVTKATLREVMEDSCGGPYPLVNGEPPTDKQGNILLKQNSAYMLVYIRQSRAGRVLLPLTITDTPPHLQQRIEAENAKREAIKKEREESHLYMDVRVITEETFRSYGGVDLTSWDDATSKYFRVLRKSTLAQLSAKLADGLGVDPRRIRYWNMVNRQNKTNRPDLPTNESDITVEIIAQKSISNRSSELRLWAEVAEEVDESGLPVWPAHQPANQLKGTSPRPEIIVLFLKYFDIDSGILSGVGHIYIRKDKKVEDLAVAILEKMQWPNETQLRLFEEIKPQMVDAMSSKQTLKAAELQDGDIVAFQQVRESKSSGSLRSSSKDGDKGSEADESSGAKESGYTALTSFSSAPTANVKEYYEYLSLKRTVTFYPYSRQPIPAKFQLILSSKNTYEQLSFRVADKLDVPPTHLKFWLVATNGVPRAGIKRVPSQTLQNILNPPYLSNTGKPDSLMYEVLEMSLAELETKKAYKITLISEGITKEELFEVLVPRNGTVADLVTNLIKKSGIEDEDTAGPIRIYETLRYKIHRELSREATVATMTEYLTLCAERIPKEELDLPHDELIRAFHFEKDPDKTHGVPFHFKIIPDEKFSDTKKRLETRIGLQGKNFEKIKFAVVKKSYPPKTHYLSDDDIIWDVAENGGDFLGLDHVDRARTLRLNHQDLFLK
ncbi:ubiquitin carboxyl-terminal hydrolase-like protein [Calycina marina]|uniref:ubiquitinyl hydrolase 1 n=1 Tax=Calycina marina TaxID=1763456 RepID=A0A9P7Z6Z7_9HELO|nr:ubiquitin carboxyl-terminal hydrolase-like protein [Calycina marina]